MYRTNAARRSYSKGYMMGPFAIETEGLVKRYRTRWSGREIVAVQGISLQVPAGIKYGLLGPNGAGKTTFVKMLLSSVRPTAGRASIFGRDAQVPEARQPVGYLPENHRFPTYLTGRSMLDFYSALSGMEINERRQRADELLSLVGLDGWGDVRIKKYSKGMLQRLGLAQALMHRPRLLILDEPTDGVDPVGRRQIRDILNQLTGTGVTVFLNSHLLGEVEAFCDHVAILRKGRIALQGNIQELVTGQGYRIVASNVPPQFRGPRAAGATAEFTASSKLHANELIDELRRGGALIETVAVTKGSLEDLFMEATRAETAA